MLALESRGQAGQERGVPASSSGQFWPNVADRPANGIKRRATTLGKTGGATVAMSWLGETIPQAGLGGLNRYPICTALLIVCIPQRAGSHPGADGSAPV